MRIIITAAKLKRAGACEAARQKFSAQYKQLDIATLNIYAAENRWLCDCYYWCLAHILEVTARDEYYCEPAHVAVRHTYYRSAWHALALDNATPGVEPTYSLRMTEDYHLVRLKLLADFVQAIADDPSQWHKIQAPFRPRLRK